ncbi:MAG TPA: TauD/TfdA family dioxygenase [Thermoanaerobaculia bacterium]|nr:TauD/TfdA family dioxygenase [Thermoanaerobaculia bacterium]
MKQGRTASRPASAPAAAPGALAIHRPLASTFGLVLEAPAGAAPGAGPEVLAGPAGEGWGGVAALLREHGAVLFRGFAGGRDGFLAVSEALSRDFSTYRGGFFHDRKPVDGNATLLTVTGAEEGYAVPLHGEMYYNDRRPGLLWFHCERPAAEGGETTLADGEEVWRRLGEESRRLFTGRRVTYRRRLADGAWQEHFQTADPAAAAALCAEGPTRFRHDPATGEVTTELTDWAVHPGRSGERDTFINNVVALYLGELSSQRGTLPPSVRHLGAGRFPMVVRMEDGAPVPGRAIKELLEIHRRHAVAVRWQAGDFLVVDNTRVLHGRLAHSGGRQVTVRLADPAF